MWKKRLSKILLWLGSIMSALVMLITILLWVYKDEIVGMAIDQANKYLKVKVQVSEVDLTFWGSFPNLSIDFNDVFVQDAFEGSTTYDTLLFTERIRCKFNPMDIWNEKYEVKSIEVEKGTLQLKIDSLGNNNYDIFKVPDSTESENPIDFKLERLYTNGIRFSYLNKKTAQYYSTRIDKLGATGDFTQRNFTAKTSAEFNINEARTGEIAIVKDQQARLNLGISINLDSSKVSIPGSVIYISELPFNFNAEIDSLQYQVHLDGKDLSLDEVANKLAPDRTREIRNFSGRGNVEFNLDVKGENDPEKGPKVACKFGVENGSLKDPDSGVNIRQLAVKGLFERGDRPGTESLKLDQLKFTTQLGVFDGNLSINNFLKPVYQAKANGVLDLSILHQLLAIPGLEDFGGKADLRTKLIVAQDKDRNGKDRFDLVEMSGEVDLDQAYVKISDDKRVFENISGSILFHRDQVGVKDFRVKVLDSDMKVNGIFSGINDFINGSAPVHVDVDVNSGRIRIADLSSSDKESKKVGEREYVLPNTLKGSVVMNIGDLEYEGHHFRNCEGLVKMNERNFEIDKFHCTNSGSKVSGKVSIVEDRPEIMQLNCNLVSNNIGFSDLFKEWNNFDQNVITSDNISGDAQINLQLYAPFDFRNGVVLNNIVATAVIRIQNGRLKNVVAFNEIIASIESSTAAKLAIGKENIRSFSSKLRDLKFETLENTITIRNSIISIPTMSVQSSALDVEISGKHQFNNDIDYRFGFRFRDLKQKKESEFGEIVDDGTGKYIFLRMYGNMDDPTIEWDKETNREKRQEKIEQEKQDAKSILKTEFGLFKNDSTVKTYIQEKRPQEEVTVSFDVLESNDSIIKQKPKKDTKVSRLVDKWKKESEAEKREEFTIGGD